MNIRQAVLWDSGAILALLDADDADHQRAVAIAGQIASERRPSFITNYIEVDAHALLLRKLGRTLAREWLLAGGLPVIRVLPQEEDRAREIVARYSDKDWTLCDAISFAVLHVRESVVLSRSIAISFSTARSKFSVYRADSALLELDDCLTRRIGAKIRIHSFRKLTSRKLRKPGAFAPT